MDITKINTLCFVEKTLRKRKDNLKNGRRKQYIITCHLEYIKNTPNSIINRQASFKMGRGYKLTVSKSMQMARKHMKICSTLLALRETQLKTTGDTTSHTQEWS